MRKSKEAMAVAKSKGKVGGGALEQEDASANAEPRLTESASSLAVPLLNRIILLSLWVTTTHTNYSA